MSTLFADIEFARPAFLWLLLLLPLIWLATRRRGVPVFIIRALLLGLVVVTLADPQFSTRQSRAQERIFAFDVSDSIPSSLRQWMKDSRNGIPAPGPNDRVFVFGSAAVEAANWNDRLSPEGGRTAGLQSG